MSKGFNSQVKDYIEAVDPREPAQRGAFNFATMTPYTGRNAALEGSGEYNAFATFNQIRQLGMKVNKGAKGMPIFCGFHERTKDKDGNALAKPVVGQKFATVFDIKDTNALDDPEFAKYLRTELGY